MQIKTTSDVGALIRDRRKRLGLSQQELAKRAGVSRLWIVQLEKGKPTSQIGLALRTLRELGFALDATARELVSSQGEGAGPVDLNRIIRNAQPTKS